jgi:hypothetical protein
MISLFLTKEAEQLRFIIHTEPAIMAIRPITMVSFKLLLTRLILIEEEPCHIITPETHIRISAIKTIYIKAE